MTPGPRLARAAVFAALCVSVSGLGHALMSGAGMPLWALAYAFAAVTSAAWWLTDRERGAGVVLGATVVTQMLLHCLFMLGQLVTLSAPRGMDSAPGMDGMAGMESYSSAAPTAAMPGTSAMHDMGLHEWSSGMLLAHVGAGLVSGLWLWRGQSAVFRLARALALVLRDVWDARPVRLAPPPCVVTPVPADDTAPRPLDLLLLRHVVVRRGPPVLPEHC
ncbi:hypothetical protein [Streptomyces sp. NPDC050560]|uniref:hypothetical protein n=1 Tax=Streptomyces sp. NPDC050560 TaxID=3365630 RepID=UPI0037B66D08